MSADDKAIQKPIGGINDTKVTIQNWTSFLGKAEYYKNYVDFFWEEIDNKGPIECIEEYIFGNPQNQMLNRKREKYKAYEYMNLTEQNCRSFSGVLHPLIHWGYGLEYKINGIIVEGLAITAVHGANLSSLKLSELITKPKSSEASNGHTEKRHQQNAIPSPSFDFRCQEDSKTFKPKSGLSAFQIIHEISQEAELVDPIFQTYDTREQFSKVAEHPKLIPLLEKWEIEEDSDWAEILERTKELIWMVAVIYTTSYDREKGNMHLVTSSQFLPVILPNIDPRLRPILLKAFFRTAICIWVGQGRMELRITECMKEPSFMKIPDSENPKGSENPWFQILECAAKHPDEHTTKIIRTLSFGSNTYGTSQVGYYGCELKGSELLDSTLFLRLCVCCEIVIVSGAGASLGRMAEPSQAPIRRRRQSSIINNHSTTTTTSSSSTNSTTGQPGMNQQQQLSNYLRSKIPALISLAIGIIVGLLFALILSSTANNSDRKSSQWRGGATVPTWTHSRTASTKSSVPIPTLDQRFRVFNLLSTLTGHHTQQCTKAAQKPYKRQVYERYEPLLGYDPSTSNRKNKKNGNGAIHLFKHLMPGNQDPDLDFTGIIDFKGHSPKLSMNTRRSTPETEENNNKGTSSSSDSSKRSSKAMRRKSTGHKYFFAINLYNSFDVIPDLFSTMFKVSAILGFQNVFVSVYENGSSDQTKALLRLFDGLSRSVGIRVVIRTSLRTRGAFHHRIEYLAEVRNAALAPLQELRDSEGELFDTVIFMNDVLPCQDDLLELIWQSRRQNAGITCGADYIFHEEIAQPVFYDMRFRMAKLSEGECSASECSLICNDYWNAGYGRIVMVPRVKLAYDNRVWQIIHPDRKNLTVIRGYTRLGGTPDDPTADPQDRAWFGPHDRLFRFEEIWCWGWDGAGDLDGPDVDPIWEPTKNLTFDPRIIRHDRGFDFNF
ncbi:hypothetical protein PSTT_03363 [Puccinia striiformis]|uniref:Glycosyltransferase family 69 protein n=1 Tax=Puccinia striiformis TaxID=27350 RepID=A0A2S4VWX8_9BASI|nr:hypothetical protein PSTT_03363 [Puccinia striiformis]